MKVHNSSRNGIVDLWRFIACIVIMTNHLYHILPSEIAYPFENGWIFIVLFFIFTGYFTMSHFKDNREDSLDEKAKRAIQYTINKFTIFLPYTIFAATIQCVIEFVCYYKVNGFTGSGGFLLDIPCEALLLRTIHVTPLWYLSSLLLIFPFFCCLCQMGAKHFLYIVSFFVPIVFCGYTDIYSDIVVQNQFLNNIIKAFVFLFLGVLVYALSEALRSIKVYGRWKIVLTFLEEICLLAITFFTFWNKGSKNLFIFLFVIGLTIMLSKESLSDKLRGNFFSWLAKISIVIYIIHWVVGTAINTYLCNVRYEHKVFLYYLLTFVIAILLNEIVERVFEWINAKWQSS